MRRVWWLALACVGLMGCPCTTEDLTIAYPITEEEAKGSCEDFCGQAVLYRWVSSREVTECELGLTEDGAQAFVCTFAETTCAPASDHF